MLVKEVHSLFYFFFFCQTIDRLIIVLPRSVFRILSEENDIYTNRLHFTTDNFYSKAKVR